MAKRPDIVVILTDQEPAAPSYESDRLRNWRSEGLPALHGVTQTDGIGKLADDPRLRWLRPTEVPTVGHWLRAADYDTHYDGKWHVSHADLI